MLAARCNDALGRLVGAAEFSLMPVADSLAQRSDPGGGGVFRALVVQGFDGRLLDVLRSGEVGLPRPEVDDVHATGLEALSLHDDGGGGGHGDSADAFCKFQAV